MKYQKIVQKDYCCTAACLEMILNRHHIYHEHQEEIAYQLGLIVPPEYKDYFKKVRIGKKPSSGYGTQIHKDEFSINHYFQSNQIPMEEEYYYILNKQEVYEFLSKHENDDVIICLHCGILYGKDYANWGHMVLFEYLDGEDIIILDPSPKRNYERIKVEDLINAIKVHGKDNGAGFWLIKKIN